VSDSTIDATRSTRTPLERPSVRDRLVPLARAWRPVTAAWLGLLAGVTLVGLLLVGPLDDGRVAGWDLEIERWLADHRTAAVNTLAEAGTWLAETITVPVVLLVTMVVAWRVCSNVAAPAFLAAAVGGEKLLYLVSSMLVDRPRPPVPTVGTSYATSSFPSGHVGSALVLYGGIALVIALRRSTAVRLGLLAIAGALAVVVALCRMYTGFHYLSDCVAGGIVGATWLAVTYRKVLCAAEVEAARRPDTGGDQVTTASPAARSSA
jgi:membrane-associated phospholipid phosphatase